MKNQVNMNTLQDSKKKQRKYFKKKIRSFRSDYREKTLDFKKALLYFYG